MQSHSREATGTVTRLINMQSHSHEATIAQSQSRRVCYPILLNMKSHSREATVMPRRRGVAASYDIYFIFTFHFYSLGIFMYQECVYL